TTTLAAMIEHINRTKQGHIVTIEDPIEVLFKDDRSSINQREVGNDTESFQSALRAALRQDPDVILIGEMRDTDTVRAALQAAETGHLVLSTLHTVDATETVNRVLDFFPPHQQQQIRFTLAGALKGIVCQRLVTMADGGRTPGVEIMVNTGRIAERIADPDKTSEIHELIGEGRFYGMVTFDQSLVELVSSGQVEAAAALETSSSPHDFQLMLQQAELTGRASTPRPRGERGGRQMRSLRKAGRCDDVHGQHGAKEPNGLSDRSNVPEALQPNGVDHQPPRVASHAEGDPTEREAAIGPPEQGRRDRPPVGRPLGRREREPEPSERDQVGV